MMQNRDKLTNTTRTEKIKKFLDKKFFIKYKAICYKLTAMSKFIHFTLSWVRSLWDLLAFYDYRKKIEREICRSR